MEKFSALTAFVHVPKTAGSTINSHLFQSGRMGQDHIEAWRNREPEHVREQLRKLDWVSGHVNFPEMRKLLCTHTARPIHFYTALRNPIKQIASHYNWLIEIFYRGEAFYDSHPPQIKEISERIRKTDNGSPHAIIAQLEAASGLFLNQQSRTVLGENLGDMSEAQLRDRLGVFRYIATEDTLPVLLYQLMGQKEIEISRENTSGYHFDVEVFRTDIMQSFLEKRHGADMALYTHVKGCCSTASVPYSPPSLGNFGLLQTLAARIGRALSARGTNSTR